MCESIIAVDTNNNLWTWGVNLYGTLGYDNVAAQNVSSAVAAANPVPRRAYLQN
jgi:alpha-tubulin suppressor-like RCC1 family protein